MYIIKTNFRENLELIARCSDELISEYSGTDSTSVLTSIYFVVFFIICNILLSAEQASK